MARIVTVATAQVARPDWDRGSVRDNLSQCSTLLEVAGQEGADIVCLPENTPGMCVAPRSDAVQTVPGPATDAFSEIAATRRMYIIAPVMRRVIDETGNENIHNVAVIIDRSGSIAGVYRKVHLTTPAIARGDTPGNEYPVFTTDFGRIGIMICYDYFFPEAATILALNGAEILFLPTAGDGRGPAVFETLVRARAIDTCSYLVASVSQNQGRSCVIGPQGEWLADSKEIPGVVCATIDLDQRITRHEVSGGVGDLKHIMRKARRPDTYARLTEPEDFGAEGDI